MRWVLAGLGLAAGVFVILAAIFAMWTDKRLRR